MLIAIVNQESPFSFNILQEKKTHFSLFFSLSTILTSKISTYIFIFSKTKLSKTEIFSDCFYNCMEL